MKADINKRKKVFKFLGIDKSYVNSLCPIENSKDFVFEEDFKNKFTTLQDLDNLIEEKYYWEYMGDVPFQMIYPFLSQFEFHDKDDFFDFTTVRNSQLIIDYGMKVQTAFYLYDEYPMELVGNTWEFKDINPIYAASTDMNGRFFSKVSLPAYLKRKSSIWPDISCYLS